MDWEEIVTHLGGLSAIAAAIAYVAARSVDSFIAAKGDSFRQSLARDVESHKATLERDLESHKAALDRLNAEHSVRFAALHAERAVVVKTLYGLVNDLVGYIDLQATFLIVAGNGTSHSEGIRMAMCNLINYYTPNRIYLSESVCRQVENLLDATGIGRMNLHGVAEVQEAAATGDAKAEQRMSLIIESFVNSRDEVRQLKATLEQEFRALLGH